MGVRRCLLLVMFACAASAGMGQTHAPVLTAAFPPCVVRGQDCSVTLTATGGSMWGAYAVLATGGVTGAVTPPAKGWGTAPPSGDVAAVPTMQVTLHAPANLAADTVEVRVATPRGGVSSLIRLAVVDRQPTVPAGDHHSDAAAASVTVPAVVAGHFAAAGDVDYYRFDARAGEECTFAVMCARLEERVPGYGDTADPVLTLYDAHSHELAMNDDYYRADSLLHYRFAAAGTYLLKIRDVRYAGNPAWAYVLDIRDGPWVTALAPCAVTAGGSASAVATGYGTGPGAHVILNGSTPGLSGGMWPMAGGTSNPVPYLVFAGQEAQPGAQTIPAPGGASGVIRKEGQVDRYRFSAHKGTHWRIEITAERLWSRMDSSIDVTDASGSVLAQNDDGIGKDSLLADWVAPADGQYVVRVRDLTGQFGDNVFYHLGISMVTPSVALTAAPDRAEVPAGGAAALLVRISRDGGYTGPVTVAAAPLPAGVTADPLTIPADAAAGLLVLRAAAGTRPEAVPLQLLAQGTPTSADYRAFVRGDDMNAGDTTSAGAALAVTDRADAGVMPATPSVMLVRGGTVKVDFTVTRAAGFGGPVVVDFRFLDPRGDPVSTLPTGVTVEGGPVTVAANAAKGTISLKAAADAPEVSARPVVLLAYTTTDLANRAWIASTPVALTIAAAPKPPSGAGHR